MVTITPESPAHRFLSLSSYVSSAGPVNDSIAAKSSRDQVLPTEKDPFAFSFALCMRTRPVLLTATTIIRGFLFSALEFGGGGAEGEVASSVIRICVM